jgi:hypothetical protein
MPHFPNVYSRLYIAAEPYPLSPLEKIVSDDSWHIPSFLSTLSNCWTQKSLVEERLNGYSRVCFSQASWIFIRDGSAFNFPRVFTWTVKVKNKHHLSDYRTVGLF